MGFLKENLTKLVFILAAFAVVFTLANNYILTDSLREWIKEELSPAWLVATLFLSECFLGILPPDVYIVVVKSYNQPWLWVFILSIASYVGGIVSYFIGLQLYKVPRIKHWVAETYKDQFDQIRKYGGILISIAALTPLPYSPVSMVAGVIKYRFGRYLLFGLTRFLRFFLYAWVIYSSEGIFG
jgi:membrane protein YqaA with SNARE-associated domain